MTTTRRGPRMTHHVDGLRICEEADGYLIGRWVPHASDGSGGGYCDHRSPTRYQSRAAAQRDRIDARTRAQENS
jgi:hypothetical protein